MKSIKRNNLTSTELKQELKLIRRSTECPMCGAPTDDLKGKTEYTCKNCEETYDVGRIQPQSRDHLSFSKLRELSRMQVNDSTMSSKMDVQFESPINI